MSKSTVRTPMVEFSRKLQSIMSTDDADAMVRRRGVIFRAGTYEHQDFSMTPDELRSLASSFSGPIKLDHGHPSVDGPIDFGHLESVEASPDGTTLFGTTATPAWLDRALGNARWLVSASFDRTSKAIRRLSLVTRPQISDAELQAAFACSCQHEAPTTPKTEAPMTRKEQVIAELQAMSDEEYERMEAEYEIPDDMETEEEEEDMDDDYDEAEVAEEAAPSAEFARQAERVAELEAKLRRKDAEVFVDGAIKDALALPAERAKLIDRHANFAFLEATLRDAGGTANFSADGEPLTLVADFEADIRARRRHGFTREGVASFAAGGRVLDNGGDQPETDAEYAARLVAKYNGRNRITGRGA